MANNMKSIPVHFKPGDIIWHTKNRYPHKVRIKSVRIDNTNINYMLQQQYTHILGWDNDNNYIVEVPRRRKAIDYDLFLKEVDAYKAIQTEVEQKLKDLIGGK